MKSWFFLGFFTLHLGIASLAVAQESVHFVLVHGAWVSEMYWRPIADVLKDGGADVTAVNLPMTGATTTVGDQGTYTSEVIDALSGPVILVAHSAGTRPATVAWDISRDKIAAVVFIEGVLPTHSEPEVIPADTRTLQWLVINAPDIVDLGMWPPPPVLVERYGDQTRPVSLASLTGAVKLTHGPLPRDIPRVAITMTDSPLRSLARDARAASGWQHVELSGTHDITQNAAAIATALLDIAESLPK